MQPKPEKVRAEVPLKVLWKWTGVSAVIHTLIIALLCGFSYWGHQQREAASKAKAAADEAILKKKEAEDAAKAAKNTNAPPATATNAAPDKTALTPPPAATESTNRQAQAEKLLGIDKVAKPNEIPKSPFSKNGDDLLKDLK
ncbi:MAG: hypothetical protein EBS05_00270 [Proteobacteria bacterium]|jgi:predicted negative regulator of RcsB-dependent stress response|nr:hypothetical protein [Pseudomonadota bacterium]